MVEARVEPGGPEQAAPEMLYRWEPPGKPVAVHLSFEVIDRLAGEAVRAFESLPRRGVEVGGILLGTADGGEPHVVRIEDFEVIPCEYAYGPRYFLSERDKQRFEEALARRRGAGSKIRPVGYFRTHISRDLFLREQDLWLCSTWFADPSGVALLVKPFITRASIGGFFIWENGKMRADASCLEFPFSRRELCEGERSGAPVEAPAAEEAAPEPPAEKPVPESTTAAPTEPVQEVGPQPAAEPERMVASETVPVAFPAAPTPPRAVQVVVSEPEPLRLTAQAAEAGGRRWAWIPAAALLAVTSGVGGYLAGRHTAPPPLPPAPKDPYTLSLRVVNEGPSLRVIWDRQAPPIAKASSGVLTITDGAQTKTLDLDPGQLRHGAVVYQQATNAVRFRLEVVTGEKNSVSEQATFGTGAPAPPARRPAKAPVAPKPTVAKPQEDEPALEKEPPAAEKPPVVEPEKPPAKQVQPVSP